MFLKKSSSKSTVKNVVTLNPYLPNQYIYKDENFHPMKKLSYNTANFITSYIRNKDIITSTVHISRSIPEEDIPDIIEIKAYEEMGLDQAKSYTISHMEVESDEEERLFHIFVAEPDDLDALFLPLKEETKYFDLIVPTPLLYKTLYTQEILKDRSTHCFVYLTQNDAFVTIYKNGEYLYSKSIDFNLEQIYNRFCEIIGEKIEEEEFYKVLESEGLKTTNSEYQQNFMKIFAEVFVNINDIIIYAKRAFNLDTIHEMFIGSTKGPIIGLDEYSNNYLGLHSSDLNFNFNIANEEWYTDQLQYMMLLASFEYMQDASTFLNLSLYPRAPAFPKRASGQFIISTFTAVSLSLSYPLIHLVGSYVNDATIYALKIENTGLSKEVKKYKRILGKKKNIITKLDTKIKDVETRYENKTKTLTFIYDKKVNYRLKSGIFHMLAEDLHKYDLHVERISTEGNRLEIALLSQHDRKITEMIKYFSETHFEQIKHIDIERIEKNEESNLYKGLLKVELK